MAKKGETEFDDYKDTVYRDIRWLEFFEKDLDFERRERNRNSGCLGVVLSTAFGEMFRVGRSRMKRYRNIAETETLAAEILAKPLVKKALCQVLDESIRLPIDVAHAITLVLYRMNKKEITIPSHPIVYAVISKQIADQGAVKYCL